MANDADDLDDCEDTPDDLYPIDVDAAVCDPGDNEIDNAAAASLAEDIKAYAAKLDARLREHKRLHELKQTCMTEVSQYLAAADLARRLALLYSATAPHSREYTDASKYAALATRSDALYDGIIAKMSTAPGGADNPLAVTHPALVEKIEAYATASLAMLTGRNELTWEYDALSDEARLQPALMEAVALLDSTSAQLIMELRSTHAIDSLATQVGAGTLKPIKESAPSTSTLKLALNAAKRVNSTQQAVLSVRMLYDFGNERAGMAAVLEEGVAIATSLDKKRVAFYREAFLDSYSGASGDTLGPEGRKQLDAMLDPEQYSMRSVPEAAMIREPEFRTAKAEAVLDATYKKLKYEPGIPRNVGAATLETLLLFVALYDLKTRVEQHAPADELEKACIDAFGATLSVTKSILKVFDIWKDAARYIGVVGAGFSAVSAALDFTIAYRKGKWADAGIALVKLAGSSFLLMAEIAGVIGEDALVVAEVSAVGNVFAIAAVALGILKALYDVEQELEENAHQEKSRSKPGKALMQALAQNLAEATLTRDFNPPKTKSNASSGAPAPGPQSAPELYGVDAAGFDEAVEALRFFGMPPLFPLKQSNLYALGSDLTPYAFYSSLVKYVVPAEWKTQKQWPHQYLFTTDEYESRVRQGCIDVLKDIGVPAELLEQLLYFSRKEQLDTYPDMIRWTPEYDGNIAIPYRDPSVHYPPEGQME